MEGLSAVLMFSGLTLLLALSYALPRVPQVLLGKRKADAWTRGNAVNDPGILVRAQHAHLNALETLPVFAAVVIIASLMGKADAVAALAGFVLYARVGQVIAHLLGTSFILVIVRATFFIIQTLLMLFMISKLV